MNSVHILIYPLRVTEYLCLHKSLFGDRFTSADLLSFVIFFVAAGISAGGGVGGGGIRSFMSIHS